MKELFDKLESHVVTHLWDINRELDDKGGFSCPQQVDDVKDCLCAIKHMHEILMMVSVK